MSKNLDKYVTTKRAAEMLGVDHSQAARLLKAGKLQGVKLGHDWIVFVPSLEKYHATKSRRGRPASKVPQLRDAR